MCGHISGTVVRTLQRGRLLQCWSPVRDWNIERICRPLAAIQVNQKVEASDWPICKASRADGRHRGKERGHWPLHALCECSQTKDWKAHCTHALWRCLCRTWSGQPFPARPPAVPRLHLLLFPTSRTKVDLVNQHHQHGG